MMRRVLGSDGVILALTALAVACVPAESWAQGCAMCATYLSGPPDARTTAFKVSIMFLMAMPFLVFGSAGGWIVWMHWRSRPREASLAVLQVEREGAS